VIAWLALRALPWRRILPVLVLLAVVGGLIAWHVHRVDKARAEGYALGKAEAKGRCEADTLTIQRREDKRAAENRARADRESALHEAERDALRQQLQEARDAARTALRRPIKCPASGLAVGDIILPGDALRSVRGAASSGLRAD
jgi:hypothetical protein